MADSAIIETLLIKIGADIVDLKKGVNDANKQLEGLDKTTKKTSANMTASFVQMVKGLAPVISIAVAAGLAIKAFQAAVANTQGLDQLSQATGISIQRLSELRNVTLALGLDFETLSQAIRQFGPRMTEQLANPASKGAQALNALGINARDAQGNLQNLDQLLPAFADAFAKYADGSNKAAIAAALFGEEAGPKLIPLLNKGAAGLDELRKKLGATATEADVNSLREYNAALGQFQVVLEQVVMEVVKLAAESGVIDLLKKLAEALAGLRAPKTLDEEIKRAAKELYEAQVAATDLINRLTDAQNATGFEGIIKRFMYGPGASDGDQMILHRETIAMEHYLALLDKANKGMTTSHVLPQGQQAPVLDPLAIEKAQFAYDQLIERISGSRTILDEMNFAWADHSDRVAMAVEKINAIYAEGFRRDRAIAQAKKQLALQEQQQILDTASLAASTITALFPKSKGAAIAAAVINTAVGITNALSRGSPPWNWIQAGLIAATGAAQIAAIRSTTESGGGASPSVNGGGGQPGGVAEEQTNRSITVQGIDRNALFSGTQMASLIDALNEETKRGSTLIATTLRPT